MAKIILGIIMCVGWWVINIWVRRRDFNRTNQHGVKEYKSFGDSMRSNSLEALAKLVAGALFIGGVIMVMWGYLEMQSDD